jgi:hypothetical protein
MNLIAQADNPVARYFEKHKARGHKFAMAATRAKLVNVLSGIARNGTPYIDAVPGQPSDWLAPDAESLAAQED